MPLFSIIIPTFNRAHIIESTIASIQQQTCVDWECIIVDDGSSDNTKEVIDSIPDTRISYVYQQNSERSAARNNGISHAKGTYICFLDSDDKYESNHLEVLKENIFSINSTTPALYFVHAIHVIHGEKSYPDYLKLGINALEYMFTEPIIPARICVHKDILKQFQFDEDIVIVEDMVLWTKIASEYSIYQISEYTVQYHLHEDNSVNLKNNSYIKRYEGIQIFMQRYPSIVEKIPLQLHKTILSNTLFGIAKHYIYMSQLRKALQYILFAIIKKINHPMTVHRILLVGAICKIYPQRILKEYIQHA